MGIGVAAAAAGLGVGIVAAIIVGLPALRVKGLFLAVTTLAFAVMAQTWLFRQKVFLKSGTSARIRPQKFFGWTFPNDRKQYYYFCLIILALLSIMVARLRRTGLGRSLIAVRENEDMAAASTVSPTRIKLTAFGIAGGIAGLAGAFFCCATISMAMIAIGGPTTRRVASSSSSTPATATASELVGLPPLSFAEPPRW